MLRKLTIPLLILLRSAAPLLLLASLPLAGAELQSRADAWWTGPMLAPSAATLPSGHVLIEPYLFDVMTDGNFDAQGGHHAAATDHDFGSLTYMLYGLTDRVTIGMIPRFFHDVPPMGAASSGIDVGDLTLQAGYGLTRYEDGRSIPAIAVVLDATLPTGRYDRLSRASAGTGSGAYAAALSLYTQDYFWLPNGRILRARLDLTYTRAAGVSVQDQSVYATGFGFYGRAYPGDGYTADLAGEYSMTRRWVLALDVVYQYNGNTRVRGSYPVPGGAFEVNSRSGYSLGFAPAIEYNLSARIGLLLGVRIIQIGRNASSSVTPALALNMVF